MSPFEHANVLPLGDGRLKHLQFVQAPLLLLFLREHLVQLRLLGQSLLHLLLLGLLILDRNSDLLMHRHVLGLRSH